MYKQNCTNEWSNSATDYLLWKLSINFLSKLVSLSNLPINFRKIKWTNLN